MSLFSSQASQFSKLAIRTGGFRFQIIPDCALGDAELLSYIGQRYPQQGLCLGNRLTPCPIPGLCEAITTAHYYSPFRANRPASAMWTSVMMMAVNSPLRLNCSIDNMVIPHAASLL